MSHDAIDLQQGVVYQSKNNGLVEYMGLDHFMGETTFKFRRLSDSSKAYIKPESLEFYLVMPETIDSVTKQRDKLHRLEVSANTVACCYDRNPGNFAGALIQLRDDARSARELLAAARGEQC